jgi:hypothetical protein
VSVEVERVVWSEEACETALDVFCSGRSAREAAVLRGLRRGSWRRLLQSNPHRSGEAPGYFCLARRYGRACGLILCVPERLQTDSSVIPAHWGVDLYVPGTERKGGVGRALLQSWRDSTPVTLGLGITPEALRLELSLGWKLLHGVQRWQKALSRKGQLLLAAARRREGALAGAGGRASWLFAAASSRQETAGRLEFLPTLEQVLPTALDSGLRDWEGRVEGGLRGLRSEDWLRWRYGERDTGWRFGVFRAADRGLALGIVRVDERPLRRKLWIYELLGETQALRVALLRQLVEYGTAAGFDVLELRGGPGDAGLLESLPGLLPGRPEAFIVHAAGEAGSRLLQATWSLTLGDSGNG